MVNHGTDDVKHKNFTSCFKEQRFLEHFYPRISRNEEKYAKDFPWISKCGLENNYIRCDDLPIVFTSLLDKDKNPVTNETYNDAKFLAYANFNATTININWKLVYPFDREKLHYCENSGRVYHPMKSRYGGVGLVKSQIVVDYFDEFSKSMSTINEIGSRLEKYSSNKLF